MADVTVSTLLDELGPRLGLRLLAGAAGLARRITASDVSRPGLALVGHFDYYQNRMIQVIGLTELDFLNTLPAEKVRDTFSEIFRRQIACLIVTRNLPVSPDILRLAEETGTPLLATPQMTTPCIAKIYIYLEHYLAPRTTVHGVLVDVFGVGVLLSGGSGLGKSECALELIERGHRLVADDVVDIISFGDGELVGRGAELIKYHMEVRGLGIINVRSLFGLGAVRDSMRIDMVIRLEDWREGVEYDRLGLDEQHESILGVEVPKFLVPVRPGRNLAIIIEVASRNLRARQMGVHSAREFNEQLLQWIKSGSATGGAR